MMNVPKTIERNGQRVLTTAHPWLIESVNVPLLTKED